MKQPIIRLHPRAAYVGEKMALAGGYKSLSEFVNQLVMDYHAGLSFDTAQVEEEAQ